MTVELRDVVIDLFKTENGLPVTVVEGINGGKNLRLVRLRNETTRYAINVDPDFAGNEQLAEHVKQAVIEAGAGVGLMPNKALLWYVGQFRREMGLQ